MSNFSLSFFNGGPLRADRCLIGTATVTTQGPPGRYDTTKNEEWGLLSGHQWGPQLATSGDFFTATDTPSGACPGYAGLRTPSAFRSLNIRIGCR